MKRTCLPPPRTSPTTSLPVSPPEVGGNNLKGLEYRSKAIIWSGLSYVRRIRSTALGGAGSGNDFMFPFMFLSRGRDCVKSLWSSHTGLYSQRNGRACQVNKPRSLGRVMGGTNKDGGTLRSVEVFDPRVGQHPPLGFLSHTQCC
jgi:hypothetical protein